MPSSSKLLAFLSVACVVAAQPGPVVSLTGPASVSSGDRANLTVNLSGSAGKDVAAVQFSLTLPSGMTLGEPALSPAWVEAGFSISCGSSVCVVVNASNANPSVADGLIATVPVVVSPRFASGTVPLPMTPVVATSRGHDAKATAGATYSIRVYGARPHRGRS